MDLLINNYCINDNSKVFIIAELSANHNQDIDIALKTIKAAKEAGADAVKLQTYTADTITINCDNKYFRINQDTLWDGQTLYELYQKAYTPWEWHKTLKDYAESLGLILFSSPFDKSSVDFLEDLDMPAYKIASFEITDIPLIEYVASKNKPIIMSTGIAHLSDIEEAINACKRMGNNQIAILKCTSSYPAPFDEINLNTIPHLKRIFDTHIGISDHTLGSSIPIASVALGSKIIEKHFILDKSLGGPDAEFSMTPNEFKLMVDAIRNVELAMGSSKFSVSDKSLKNRSFSRSLFVVDDVKMGEQLNENNIRSIRPGYGMSPKYIKQVIGKTACKDIKRGTPLSWDLFK